MLTIITLLMFWHFTRKKDGTHSAFCYVLVSFIVTVFCLILIVAILFLVGVMSGKINLLGA